MEIEVSAEAKAKGFEVQYNALNGHDDPFDASVAMISTAISIAAVAALKHPARRHRGSSNAPALPASAQQSSAIISATLSSRLSPEEVLITNRGRNVLSC